MPRSKPFLPSRQRDTEVNPLSAAYPSLEGGTRNSQWAGRGSARQAGEEDGAALAEHSTDSAVVEGGGGCCACTCGASTLETVRAHVKATTLHAFPRAVECEEASVCWKFFWLALGLCCILGGVWFSVDSVKSYRRREHFTIIKSEFHPSLELPAVTICNSNPLRKSLERTLEYYDDLAQFWNDALHPQKIKDFEPTAEQLMKGCHHGGMIQKWRMSAKSFTDQALNGGPNIDNVLKSSVQIPDDFSGCCWTVNPGPEVLSHRIGHSSSLHLLINLQPYEFFNPAIASATFRVAVHPQNEPPNMDNAFELGANMSHSIAVRKTVVTQLAEGKDGCVDGEKSASLPILPPFSQYSFESCIKACVGAVHVRKCKCRLQGTAGGLHERLCGTLTLKQLLFPHTRKQKFKDERPECVAFNETEAYAECNQKCKIPCRREIFSAQLKSASKPLPEQVLRFFQYTTFGEIAISELLVDYESFNVEDHSTTLATPLSTLLGTLGGNFGLFIGASFVSVIETALSMVDCLFVFCLQLPPDLAFWAWVPLLPGLLLPCCNCSCLKRPSNNR